MHAVSRAVRLPHGLCNNLIFGKRLDQAPSGEPSARKAKQAKTRLRAAYDMAPSRASIEIAFTFAAKTLKMLTKRCVFALFGGLKAGKAAKRQHRHLACPRVSQALRPAKPGSDLRNFSRGKHAPAQIRSCTVAVGRPPDSITGAVSGTVAPPG